MNKYELDRTVMIYFVEILQTSVSTLRSLPGPLAAPGLG